VYDSVTNDGGIETGQVTRFVVPVNFTNNGYLNNNAYTVIEQGNFVNNGDLYISAGTQFRVDGGASTLGGRMTGGGHFENSTPLTPVEVSGRIEPGLPGETGTFHFVGGNTVHWSTFQLVAELGGEFPFQPYDRLEIAGNCQLDGVLQIDHLPGFAPAVGDSFEVLACTQGGLLTGSFLVHNGLVQDGITLAPVYFPDRLVLVVQSVTGVEEGGPPEEARFAVRHTPGDVARFEFVLPWDGQVEIGLFDLSGRSVGRLGPMDSGEGRGELAWSTRALASGAYFAKLLARPLDGPGDITLSGRLLVTR
jgi:hypothetical protein